MTNNRYLKVGQSAKNRLFGIAPLRKLSSVGTTPSTTPTGTTSGAASRHRATSTPINMMVSNKLTISNSRLAVIVVGVFTLAIGIILSSIPWLDYVIMKNLKIINGTLSYHYWHKPGVIRLTKVFIFNVTNPDGFLNGEKPKLVEFGPFVYREDMEKVNIKFNKNGTVSFQHNKVLQFMPEMSIKGADDLIFTVPNIPLLTLTSQANGLKWVIRRTISMALSVAGMEPFKKVKLKEFVFGYDDTLTALASTFFPKGKRPPKKMGLFLLRNGTLSDRASVYTGETGWEKFGYMDKLNKLDHLPYWSSPCNSIMASEGSFFPPRSLTKSDIVYLYDKDLCRAWTLKYRKDVVKQGISAGYYTPHEDMFTPSEHGNNTCFCPNGICPLKGLQNISPCQFDSPLYISYPHFYNADPSLLAAVQGLSPNREKHETFVKINSKIGVPIEARARVQLNLMVEQSDVEVVKNFPSIIFPIIWLEEGIDDLPPHLQSWIYLATTFADTVVPIVTYGMIVIGALVLIVVFIRTYQNIVFTTENLELGKRTLRRGSSFLVNGQHKLMILRDSYTLLKLTETDGEQDSST